MRKWLIGTLAVLLAATQLPAQSTTILGEVKQLCRVWDGTDVALVDASGNQMVAGTLTCNAGSGTFIVGDGAGALNVIVDTSALPAGAATEATLATRAADATVTNRLPAGSTPADNESNAITVSRLPAYMYVFDGTTWDRWQGAVTVSGTVTANQGGAPWTVTGTKSNNGGVPGATNLGTLPAVANAAAPTQTETNQVALRVQLDGDLVTVMEDELPAGTQNIGDVDIVTLPNEGQQTAANSISVTPDTDNDAIGATGAAPPGEAAFIGGLTSGATGGFVTGFAVCDSFANVNVVTATTTLLVTGVSGRHVRICSLSLLTAGANNVALISGTGATCGTGTTGMTGGTTAATGYNFSANGGLTQGSGLGAINQTNATGDSVCVITSAAVQLSGRIAYAIY